MKEMRRFFYIAADKAVGFMTEFLLFLPLTLTLGLTWFNAFPLPLWFSFLSGAYLSGLVARSLLKRLSRIFTILAGAALASAIAMYAGFEFPFRFIMPVLFMLLYLRGMILSDVPWRTIFPVYMHFVGLFAYFAVYFFYSRIEGLKPFVQYLAAGGFAATVLSLFTINVHVLRQASQSDLLSSSAQPAINRNNRRLIAGILIVITLAASYSSLKDLLSRAWSWLVKAVYWLLMLLYREPEAMPDSTPPPQEAPPWLLPIDDKPPSILDEIILTVLGYTLLAAAVILILYFLFRLIVKLAGLIARVIGKLIAGPTDHDSDFGYRDERESLLSWETVRNDANRRFKELLDSIFKRQPRWEDLKDNREKARFLYRHFLLRAVKRGYAFKKYLTPVETAAELALRKKARRDGEEGGIIPESGMAGADFAGSEEYRLSAVYSEARYGTGDINAEDIRELKGWLDGNQERQ